MNRTEIWVDGTKKKQVDGVPDENLISTSYAERQNLNIRMKNRRFTRLTNAFSTKFEHHVAANFSTTAGAVYEAGTRYLNWPMHWHK